MLSFHCKKIKKTIKKLDEEYLKLHKMSETEKEYEVVCLIENEKTAIFDTVSNLIQQLELMLDELDASYVF